MVRTGGDSCLPAPADERGADSGNFELLLFALDHNTDYYIESNGMRSPVFHITVADIPYVENLRLEYHFPAYTGLSPQVIEDGGDIAGAARHDRSRVRKDHTARARWPHHPRCRASR